MRFMDLSLHAYLDNIVKLMKMHFQISETYKITDDQAQEVVSTLLELAIVMQNLHFYPKPAASGGAGGSNTPQTPAIQSAMSAKTDKGKSAKDVVTQKVVDDMAKALGTETVCVRVMFDISCDGRCKRSHERLDTALFFGIEKFFRPKGGSKRGVPEAKKLWQKSNAKYPGGAFVRRDEVHQKLAASKLIDRKTDDAKTTDPSKKGSSRKSGGNSNNNTTNQEKKNSDDDDKRRREIIWDGDGKKKFTVGRYQVESYCKYWCVTLKELESGGTNFETDGHGPLTAIGQEHACARNSGGRTFSDCGLETCVLVKLLLRGGKVDEWMDTEFKRFGLSCTAQRLISLLKDGKIDWRGYSQQSPMNRAAEESTDSNQNSETNAQLLNRVSQLESTMSVMSTGDASVISAGDPSWSLAEAWSPVLNQGSAPDGSCGGSDMSSLDQSSSSVLSAGSAVNTARTFGAGWARQHDRGASEPTTGHVVISDQQARHYARLLAMEQLFRDRQFQNAMARERMLMQLPPIPASPQRQQQPPPGRGGGRAGGRGGTH